MQSVEKINNIVARFRRAMVVYQRLVGQSAHKIRAGLSCFRYLPIITVGLLLSGCFGPTLTNLGPIQIKQSDLLTTPAKLNKIITAKKEDNHE